MEIIGDFILKVDDADLIAKANEVQFLVNKMNSDFAEMESIVSRTKSYWIGEAGDLQRTNYESNKESIAKMLNRLKEHPVDLLKISGNYKEAEDTNVQITQTLDTNIF